MGEKSLVLKDDSGRPAGYVIALEEEISFCARLEHERKGSLTVMLGDGSCRECAVCLPGNCRMPGDKAGVTGAYVCCGDRLLLYSDEGAKAAFLSARAGKSLRREAESRKDKSRENGGAESRRNAGNDAAPPSHRCAEEDARSMLFAQQRWPAPACFVCPRYSDGVWHEEG